MSTASKKAAAKRVPEFATSLTIREPWASCILQVSGPRKQIENRVWSTNYRGPLVIHAAATDCDLHSESMDFVKSCGIELPDDLWLSAVLGVVDLVDCIHSQSPAGLQWAKDSPWAMEPGPKVHYFILANPRRLKRSIAYTGKLGLYKITERAVLRKLAPLLAAAPKKPRTKRSAASSRHVVARGPKKTASKR